MKREEFKKYIESIGFQSNEHGYYNYKEFKIYLCGDLSYDFYNGSSWLYLIPCTNLIPIDFKDKLRSVKLKAFLDEYKMCKEEFKQLIKSIGFKDTSSNIFVYKEFELSLYNHYYKFYNGNRYLGNYNYNDLSLIYDNFKKELRSIKLKELLR